MKKKFFFDRKEKKLQMDSEENSFERCVLCGVVTGCTGADAGQ